MDIPGIPEIQEPELFCVNDYLDKTLENTAMPADGSISIKQQHKMKKIHLKTKKKNEIKLHHLKELLPVLPDPGWSLHAVSKGNFDFWTYVPHLIMLAGSFDEMYCSTWTMSRNVAIDMLELFDAGKLGKISLMTGRYFKRRETAVYALILDGLIKRKQRFVAFLNHAKIILLKNEKYHIIVEGSANLTATPRVENFIISNNEQLYNFHSGWMEGMFNE